MAITDRLKHAWNAFQNPIDSPIQSYSITDYGGYNRQSSNYLRGINYNKSDLVKSVISRIALDAAYSVDIKHLKINQDTGDQSSISSGLINAITNDANIDQTGRQFLYDFYWSMLDEGVIAAVPIDTTTEPTITGAFDINTIRVGRILQWYPSSVRVRVYNEQLGIEQDIVIDKRKVAIVESPLYTVLKESNQTLKLLEQKIKVMNSEDSRAASGKLNGFIQFPFSTKNKLRRQEAERRRGELENEMANSKYGLATLDANEKYVSTGQGLTNNLLDDIRKLQQDFYNQTGITENIMNGTASESEMLNYHNRTIDVVVTAALDEFNRKFLTKTAISQGQIIKAYRDPFKLVPVEQLANIADIFTRNAIYTPNEIRQLTGKPPHPDPVANQLFNRNIADANQAGGLATAGQSQVDPNNPPAVQSPYGQGLSMDNEKNSRLNNYDNTHTPDGASISQNGSNA